MDLFDLPTEIIYNIFKFFDLKNLLNLGYCSSSLREISKYCILVKIRNFFINGWDIDTSAKFLYSLYHDKVVCTNIDQHEWYILMESRWQPVEDYMVKKLFKDRLLLISKMIIKHNHPIDKILINNIKTLNLVSFTNNLMKQCRDYFYDENASNKLDKNDNLFVCANGVYDLMTKEFRNINPNDYISSKVGSSCSYHNYNENDPEVNMFNYFFRNLFSNQVSSEYFLDNLSRCMFRPGKINKNQTLLLNIGKDSEYILSNIVKKCFGTYLYVGNLPEPSSLDVDLARNLNKIRLMIMEHNSRYGSKINVKNLDFDFRDHNINLMLQSQDESILPSSFIDNDSIWNRICIIKYNDIDQRYLIDINIMSSVLLWKLINILTNHDEPIPIPEELIRITDNVREKCDIYRIYVNENLLADKNSSVKIDDLYFNFRCWLRINYEFRAPTRNNFIRQLSKKFVNCEYKGGCLNGFKISNQNDIDDINC